MDYLELIDKIINTLEYGGYYDLSAAVTKIEMAASLGGELILSVSCKLLEIKETHPEAFSKIAEDVNKLINYANTIGLYPGWKKNQPAD